MKSRSGSYRLERALGASALVNVNEATHASGGRVVVVAGKVPCRLAEQQTRALAEAVARTKDGADHHLAPVSEHGVQYGLPFVVHALEPLVPLEPPGALEAEGAAPLDPGAVAAIAVDLARALAFLAAQGLPHAMLSPPCVALTTGGRAVALGAAIGPVCVEAMRAMPGLAQLAATFWAPEVRDGGAPDAASDRYSLGALLVHLLGARLPGPTAPPLDEASARAALEAAGVEGPLCDVVPGLLRRAPADRLDLDALVDGLERGAGSLDDARASLALARGLELDPRPEERAAPPVSEPEAPRPEPRAQTDGDHAEFDMPTRIDSAEVLAGLQLEAPSEWPPHPPYGQAMVEAPDDPGLAFELDPDTHESDISRDALWDAVEREGPTIVNLVRPTGFVGEQDYAEVNPTLVLRVPSEPPRLHAPRITAPPRPASRPSAAPQGDAHSPREIHGWPVAQLVAAGAVAMLLIISTVLLAVLLSL